MKYKQVNLPGHDTKCSFDDEENLTNPITMNGALAIPIKTNHANQF